MQLPNLACLIVPIAHQDWTAPLDSHLWTASLFPCQNAVFGESCFVVGWLDVLRAETMRQIPWPCNPRASQWTERRGSCSDFLVQWTPYIVPLDSQRRTIVPSTLYHTCTLYFVPLYLLYRTIVPRTSYHRTAFIVPLHLLYRTIAPPTWYHCTRYIIPLHPYIVPLYPLRRTTVPPT